MQYVIRVWYAYNQVNVILLDCGSSLLQGMLYWFLEDTSGTVSLF